MYLFSIEGNPFIIRFKTLTELITTGFAISIEGNPFIIRFKTQLIILLDLKFQKY